MPVATRTFLREADGVRRFLEISWSGLEVETVTGKLGASGRAQSKVFETDARRDAWIARRIEKALHDGYREGDPTPVPAPEPEDADAERDAREAKRLRRTYGVPTFVPVFSSDDNPDASKLGGTPSPAAPWPVCPACTHPLRFLLQLRRADVPPSCRWAFRQDLIQLFLCDAQGKPGAPDWLCQADGEGWKPYAPSTLVRHVALTGRPADAPLPELPAWWIYPPRRITTWEERLDVPAYEDPLDLGQIELLEKELNLRCYDADKLAGPPCWVQSPAVPSCRACRVPMRHLFQVVTSGGIQFGDLGSGWLFLCPACRDGTFTWQCG
jgi:hypothetical protein